MSPQAIQLRYLQTLNSIAAEKNSTIIFPLPLEIFSAFQTRPVVAEYQVRDPPQALPQSQQQQQLQQQQPAMALQMDSNLNPTTNAANLGTT